MTTLIAFTSSVHSLQTIPLWAARDEIRDGVRSFAVENHVIFYVPIGQGIVVLRVWPAAQDPARFML